MKTNLKAIILTIVATALLSACYPLLSPMQPRTNPNDEENIVPVADTFAATYDSNSEIVNLT